MTENEAVEVLKDEHSYGYELNKACLIAIKALEEIQQYRTIGTVEEILNTFNTQQLKIARQHNELEEYRAIGTIEEFKALKEKNEPLKKIRNGKLKHCPTCKYVVDYGVPEQNYCDRCGQRLKKLDWK